MFQIYPFLNIKYNIYYKIIKMKIIISESQYNKIIQNIQEQESYLGKLLNFLSPNKDEDEEEDEDEEYNRDSENTDSDIIVDPGEYYIHPNYDTVTIEYTSKAIQLNNDAEILVKSIAKKANKSKITITSTLRTYEDQARTNRNNSRTDIINWYCGGNSNCELVKKWDSFVKGNMTQQQYADYLKEQDKKNRTLISKHILGLSIDITPFDSNLADVAEKLSKSPNSGVKYVVREENNNTVHIEFKFPVTGESGVKKPKIENQGIESITQDGIIIKSTENKNEYALVYGGHPSSTYGAKFMAEQGKNILSDKNVIYADKEKSIPEIEKVLEKTNPNAKITSVSGFSGGGPNTLRAMESGKYKFIGLIDPYIDKELSSLPLNTKMMSRAKNWTGYPKVKEVLTKMENSGVSDLVDSSSYNHLEIPKIFFDKYKRLM